MNILNKSNLEYHFKVSFWGNTFIKFDKSKALLKSYLLPKKNQFLNPLNSTPHLKALITKHYLKGRYANLNQKTAWVTSGAPVEHLKALGFFLLYPENHGAICGIKRKSVELCQISENEGYSCDICSYARTDIGSMLSGLTPVGNLPKPDVLVCCTNICQTVLYWYNVLAEYFKVPLVIIDTPFLYEKAQNYQIDFVKKQVENSIEVFEKISSKKLSYNKLQNIVKISHEMLYLWNNIVKSCKHYPSPLSAFDQFIHMAPIVEMRGDEKALIYYKKLYNEISKRIKLGISSIKHEKRRVLWDNLPIWHHLSYISNIFAKRGVVISSSTYTNAWAELLPLYNTNDPLDSIAKIYLHPILNRSISNKIKTYKKLVDYFHIDGIILHSNRSCKPYSVGQLNIGKNISKITKKPYLLLEADHNDSRSFSKEQVKNRLEAFFEIMGI